MVTHTGKVLKTHFTALEDPGYSYVTRYKYLLCIEAILRDPLTDAVMAELTAIASTAPSSTSDVPAVVVPDVEEHQDPRAKALLNASPVNGINVSISCKYWD